jgi:hypothetical protein
VQLVPQKRLSGGAGVEIELSNLSRGARAEGTPGAGGGTEEAKTGQGEDTVFYADSSNDFVVIGMSAHSPTASEDLCLYTGPGSLIRG